MTVKKLCPARHRPLKGSSSSSSSSSGRVRDATFLWPYLLWRMAVQIQLHHLIFAVRRKQWVLCALSPAQRRDNRVEAGAGVAPHPCASGSPPEHRDTWQSLVGVMCSAHFRAVYKNQGGP